MSLNAADEGRRRGKDRADFERAYAESYQGVNAGDTPGSGIRGSGGLSPKPSMDVATTAPRFFKGGRMATGTVPQVNQSQAAPNVDSGLAEREKRAADKEAAYETLLRQRFPGGVIDTIAKAREAQQAAAAAPVPAQLDPMASLKAPLQVAPGTFDPKATGENPFPATQAAIPSAKAPAAASITAIPSAPAPVAAAAPAVKRYELTYQNADGSFYGETREGKGQKFKTMGEAQQFSRGQAQAPTQVASAPAPAPAPAPASEVVATEQAPKLSPEEEQGLPPAPDASAPTAPAAKPSLLDTLRDIGSKAPLDVNNRNVVVQDNPVQGIRVPMQAGGTSTVTGQKIVPMSGPSPEVIASGVKALNEKQANVDAFHARQELGRKLKDQGAAETQAIQAKNAKAQSDWHAKKSGALPSPEAVAGATQVPSSSPATINSAFDAIGSTAPSVSIAGLTPPPVINAGPDPVQPMAPQSVANMDVPTLFKRPGGVRGQSRTSIIKPTPFYQL